MQVGRDDWRTGLSVPLYEAGYMALADCGYRAWAEKKLSELRCGEDEDDESRPKDGTDRSRRGYSAVINDRILKGLAFACWDSLSGHVLDKGLIPLKRSAPSDGDERRELIQRLLCSAIGIDPAQAGRWDRRENEMDGNKVFGAVAIGLRRNIQEIPFDAYWSLLWNSLRRTLGVIREEECGGRFALIEADEFRCVRLIALHPDSDRLIPDPAPKLVDKIIKEVFKQMRVRGHPITSTEYVRLAYLNWFKSYLFFRIGRPKHLGFIDELAVRSAG